MSSISSSDNSVHDNLIQILSKLRQVIVVKGISSIELEKTIFKMNELSKKMNVKEYLPIKIITNNADQFVDDAIEYLERNGFVSNITHGNFVKIKDNINKKYKNRINILLILFFYL